MLVRLGGADMSSLLKGTARPLSGWPHSDMSDAAVGGEMRLTRPVVLVALLACLLGFRLLALALNGTDLYTDEAQYWSWAQDPAFGYFSKPPLIAWLIAATTSVCGDGTFCVRLPAAVLHIVTSGVVYLIGSRLYGETTGFWAALAFATLPAVSLSSGIISTDVPLLLAWAVALLAFADLVRAPSAMAALALGLALGIGLNAKYAMAYFVPCAAIYLAFCPERSSLLRRPHLWAALALACALIAPNLLWNSGNGFATLAHTAENANWRGSLVNPGKAAEFFLAQFGVFGPILFGALLAIVWRSRAVLSKFSDADRLLLAFSVPIILAVVMQAFLSRAHANWAAPAYVAAVVLVTATMLRDGATGWMRSSLVLNAAIAFAIATATWQAGRFSLPAVGDPFARTLGNRETAEAVRTAVAEMRAAGQPAGSIIAADRDTAAALLYYGRDLDIPLSVWVGGRAARNHFELTRPFTAATPTPALLVSPASPSAAITAQFRSANPLGVRQIARGRFAAGTIHLVSLDMYRGK